MNGEILSVAKFCTRENIFENKSVANWFGLISPKIHYENQSAEGAGGLGIIRRNKVGESE